LIGNQAITDLLICLISEINKFIDTFYPGVFPSTVSYYWTDYNKDKSTVTFTSLLVPQMNSVIIFASDALKLFNTTTDYQQLLTVIGNQTVLIAFDTTYCNAFEDWNRDTVVSSRKF
jgi:hypothetical protein